MINIFYSVDHTRSFCWVSIKDINGQHVPLFALSLQSNLNKAKDTDELIWISSISPWPRTHQGEIESCLLGVSQLTLFGVGVSCDCVAPVRGQDCLTV